MNKHGFVLAETLVVVIFVMIIFTLMYSSAVPLLGRYDEISLYDDLDTTYDVYQFKSLIEASDSALNVVNAHYKKIDCSNFSSEINRCNSIKEYLNMTSLDTILYINTNYLNEVINDPSIREEIRDYLSYVKIDPDKCILILDHDEHISYMDFTEYKIEYKNLDLHGVTKPSPANRTKYYIGTETFTLNNPSRRGYNFDGWTGSNGNTPQKTLTIPQGSKGDRKYKAEWKIINYNISYNLNNGYEGNWCQNENGGLCGVTGKKRIYYGAQHLYTYKDTTSSISCDNNSFGDPIVGIVKTCYQGVNPLTYTVESDTFTLNNPTRAHYIFDGWSGTNLTGKQNKTVTIPKDSIGDRSYTANWTPVTYTISYNYNGGYDAGNRTTYNIETDTFTLNNPTRDGYFFAGWEGTGLSERTLSVTIPKGTTGDLSYTAIWKRVVTLSPERRGLFPMVSHYRANFGWEGEDVMVVHDGAAIRVFTNSYDLARQDGGCWIAVVWNTAAYNGPANQACTSPAVDCIQSTSFAASIGIVNGHPVNSQVPISHYYSYAQTGSICVGGMTCTQPYDIHGGICYNPSPTVTFAGVYAVGYLLNNADLIAMAPDPGTPAGYTFFGWSEGVDGDVIDHYYASDGNVVLYRQWTRYAANVVS